MNIMKNAAIAALLFIGSLAVAGDDHQIFRPELSFGRLVDFTNHDQHDAPPGVFMCEIGGSDVPVGRTKIGIERSNMQPRTDSGRYYGIVILKIWEVDSEGRNIENPRVIEEQNIIMMRRYPRSQLRLPSVGVIDSPFGEVTRSVLSVWRDPQTYRLHEDEPCVGSLPRGNWRVKLGLVEIDLDSHNDKLGQLEPLEVRRGSDSATVLLNTHRHGPVIKTYAVTYFGGGTTIPLRRGDPWRLVN